MPVAAYCMCAGVCAGAQASRPRAPECVLAASGVRCAPSSLCWGTRTPSRPRASALRPILFRRCFARPLPPPSPAPPPECGNGQCEFGEACSEDDPSCRLGCQADCPLPRLQCPAGTNSTGDIVPCAGAGSCMPSTGTCSCFRGYAGLACTRCAPNFLRIQGTTCVWGVCVGGGGRGGGGGGCEVCWVR